MDEWHEEIGPAAEHDNPFRAPTAAGFDDQEFPDGHPESIRGKHLSHEAAAQSIGAIHLGMGIICCALALMFAVGELQHTDIFLPVVISLILLAFGLFYFAAAAHQLKPWSRTPSAILGVVLGAATCGGSRLLLTFCLSCSDRRNSSYTRTTTKQSSDRRVISNTRHRSSDGCYWDAFCSA
jgi:hypothetical protein